MKRFKKIGIVAMVFMLVAVVAPMMSGKVAKVEAATDNGKSVSSAAPQVYGGDCLMATGIAKGNVNLIKVRDVGTTWYELQGVKLGKKFNGYIIGSTKPDVKNPKFLVKKRNPYNVYKYKVYGMSGEVEPGIVDVESPVIIVAGTKSKYSNPTKLYVNKKKVTLTKGSKYALKAKITKKSSKKPLVSKLIRYKSADKKVVTVTSKGKLKAVSEGTANVFVYAANGLYKVINVTVK